jgi:predicted nucleic acid-binding protein
VVPHFLDTNILLYSISRNPADAFKRERAIALLGRDDGALSVQVLQEFYVQATRPTRPHPLTHETAVGFVSAWTRFKVQAITLSILTGALQIKASHGFSYWDSAIIAAARALGCSNLYTEDLSHGREVEGVLIVNPFG